MNGCNSIAKILVIYDSKTGHTEKMALAIAKGAKQVKEVEIEVKKAAETSIKDLIEADEIILGSPTYYGLMSAPIKRLIDKSVKIHGKLEGKVGAAFTSSGETASGAETTVLSIVQAMLVHGIIVQGRANNKHYGAPAVGAPGKDDLRSCRDLGKRTANLVMKLKQILNR